MNEAMRLEIVQRRQSGMSMRAIAEELGVSRGAVSRALVRVQAQRDGRAAPPPRPRPRQSIIDPFEPILKELLAQYPNLTTERA
jgi:transposase